jgi:pyridoxamine 5'-phosphate oxidase
VLLRGRDQRGFVFYTNSLSRKGKQLAENPYAALCFYDDQGERQVLIDGKVDRLEDQASDRYWNSRARGSRIGAWASAQSDVLPDRATLEEKVAEFEQLFEGVEQVPRPEHWFGYRLVPERIEFWHGRPSRLHDRDVYELKDDRWVKYRLYP